MLHRSPAQAPFTDQTHWPIDATAFMAPVTIASLVGTVSKTLGVATQPVPSPAAWNATEIAAYLEASRVTTHIRRFTSFDPAVERLDERDLLFLFANSDLTGEEECFSPTGSFDSVFLAVGTRRRCVDMRLEGFLLFGTEYVGHREMHFAPTPSLQSSWLDCGGYAVVCAPCVNVQDLYKPTSAPHV